MRIASALTSLLLAGGLAAGCDRIAPAPPPRPHTDAPAAQGSAVADTGESAAPDASGSTVRTETARPGIDLGDVPLVAAPGEHLLELEVKGMTCDGCAEGVRDALAGVAGVKRVRVSFANNRAWAATDPAHVPTLDTLTAAVKEASERFRLIPVGAGSAGTGSSEAAAAGSARLPG